VSLNIASYSDDWRARLLSTFAATPFLLRCPDGTEIRCASVEGFWQGLKWPEGSPERGRAFSLVGLQAKMAAAGAPASETLTYCGRNLQIGSPEHHALGETAVRAKLEQNDDVRSALLATGDLVLTHFLVDEESQPVPDSKTFPAAVFCDIWTRLRSEITR
jgi:hypothetical protein